MGVGSVFGAIFVVPWVRAHLSPNMLIVIANVMIAVVYLLMAFVRDQTIFMLVAAAAGIGWTLSGCCWNSGLQLSGRCQAGREVA